MNRTTTTFFFMILGACSGDGDARTSAQVQSIETTTQRGSTTRIDKLDITYDGSQIREVAQYHNGAPDGRATLMYADGVIARIDFTDDDGDRAAQLMGYTDGKLTRTRYEVTGVHSDERVITYDPTRPERTKEITETSTVVGGPTETSLLRFDYDPSGRTSKVAYIEGSTTKTTELSYTPDGQLDRATSYAGASHVETYTFSYLPDGRLDEVTDTENGRYTVTYDGEGRIAEIRKLSSDGMVTTRYTYGSGHVTGLTFAPALPSADLFDLAGVSHATMSPLHWVPSVPTDIARPEEPAVCSGFEPIDACDNCLAESCCSQTRQCLTGTPCYTFYECASACTTQTCVDDCRYYYPAGAASFDSYISCAQASCTAVCQ